MIDLSRLKSVHQQAVMALADGQPARQLLLQIERELASMIRDETELTAMIQACSTEDETHALI